MIRRSFLILVMTFFIFSLASAQDLVMDIETDKQVYSIGENVSYQIILLDGDTALNEQVKVFISDISDKKTFDFLVDTNVDQSFYLDNDFASGYWKIESSYSDKTVKRFFTIGEREEAVFSIEGDKLIIKNTGNVVYTRTVRILIGDKEIVQKQNIEIGAYKEIKLVAPEGVYDIQVTDGINFVSKSDIHLTGTGRVIGALDEQLSQSQSNLGGVRDIEGESFFTAKNYSVAFIFIGAVFGLFILLLIEKMMRKSRSRYAQEMVKLH